MNLPRMLVATTPRRSWSHSRGCHRHPAVHTELHAAGRHVDESEIGRNIFYVYQVCLGFFSRRELPDWTGTGVLVSLGHESRTALTVTEYDEPQGRPTIEQFVPVLLQDRLEALVVVAAASTRKNCASGLAAHVTVMAPDEQFIWTFTF